jgi:DNA-binding IclR family transcriptional regulator
MANRRHAARPIRREVVARNSSRTVVKGKPRTTPKKDPYFSRAVGKALEVLELLRLESQPLALHQIATRVRLTKTSLFRILYTLESAGYIEKSEEGRYQPASGTGMVPTRLISRLLAVATPRLRALTREFNETTGLAFLFNNHIEVIAVVESPHIIRMGNTVGRILQPHASALGKSITAFQPEDRREQLLRSYGVTAHTPNTITDFNVLRAEFEDIRARGYSIDREETTLHGWCYGAPIFTAPDEVLASLSISFLKSRLDALGDHHRVIDAVTRTARAISEEVRRP